MNKRGIATAMLAGIIILLMGGVALVMAVTGGSGIITGGSGEKQKILCDVTVENLVLRDVKIGNVNCKTQGSCWLAIAPLSIFKKEGTTKIIFGDDVDSKSYAVNRLPGSKETITLSVCSNSKIGQVRLEDENKNLIDSKEVSLQ